MALNLGPYSDPITHDFRLADVKVTEISAPAAGSTQRGNVTVTFKLQSYEVATASVTVQYSTDGETFNTATISSGATTALSVDSDGVEHSVVWDSVTDLGANLSVDQVVIGILADDASGGGGDDDRLARSGGFAVNNLPTTPAFSDPADGAFGKDLQKYFQFSISSTDPGSGELFPYLQADFRAAFDSAELVEKDSSDGSTHDQFDHLVDAETDKPIPGYYIQGVAVDGATTVTFTDQVDLFTGEDLPASIADARVIVIQKADRRVFVTGVSDSDVDLDEAAGGAADGLVDLFVLDDPSVLFYVESGLSVTSLTPAAVTFSSMGNDDFAQDIPDTFGAAPRIIAVDQADRMVIVGTITTTSVELSKSAAGVAANGTVTLFILKDNADVYEDPAESVTSTTLTAVAYEDLDDVDTPPAYIPGAIPIVTQAGDRHVYIGDPVADQVKVAKSAAGGAANGIVNYAIATKEVGVGSIWQPMSPNGIPDDYEGGTARFRPESGDFEEGQLNIRVAFGNVA